MTEITWQLTIDSADPHTQADFWAAALGYQVEDNSELIAGLLERGYANESDTLVHRGVRSWVALKAIRGTDRRILFQAVPESKTAKNRLHLDLNVGPEGLDAAVQRLTELGASTVAEVNDRGSHSFVLADPEGNEFCVQ
ncbi:MAG TPA: VOC family protein [Propionibacteriaceae bacterium]